VNPQLFARVEQAVSAALFHHFWRRDDTHHGDAADGERVAPQIGESATCDSDTKH
jgi:hypothetical protein